MLNAILIQHKYNNNETMRTNTKWFELDLLESEDLYSYHQYRLPKDISIFNCPSRNYSFDKLK